MPDLVGQQLGTYRLIRSIGQGGFAEVYLGEHIHLGIYAAVKVLKTQVASGDIERFRAEARTIANLQNPQVVRVLDFDVQNGTPFLVMEYAPNGTLRQRHPRGGLLPPATIVPYVKQVAAALQYAHDSNVVHRDVKPENMLLGPANQVWLSDFGIAVIVSTRTSLKETAGTYSYMAPEQIQGHPCAASDQYALGIVVYEWLCGYPPFTGMLPELAAQHMFAPPPPLRQRVPALLPAVEAVVLKALAKDPKQRYASVTDFATDLEQACQKTTRRSEPLSPIPPPPLHRTESGTVLDPTPLHAQPMQAELVGPFGRIPLGPTALHIGRTPDNQLVLNDPLVSKQHAVVHPQGPGYAITDLGSVNGTFVNEQRLPVRVVHPLNAGNTIRVGNTRLSYGVKSMPRREMHSTAVPPSPIPPFPAPHTPVPPPPPPWLRVVLIAVAIIVVLGGGGFLAYHFLTPPQPVISVTSMYHVGSTPAGSTSTVLHVSGQKFSANSPITFLLDDRTVPGIPMVQSDANGNVSTNLTVTNSWSVGNHRLTARDASNDTTKSDFPVTICQQGECNTPGPNGAPPDDMTFTLIVSIKGQNITNNKPFNSQQILIITGKPDPAGGTVCQWVDTGSLSQTTYNILSNNNAPYTEKLSSSCSGTYKGGKLSYTETINSKQVSLPKGVTCTLSNPYTFEQLQGIFMTSNTFNGNVSLSGVTAPCSDGSSVTSNAVKGTWTGQLYSASEKLAFNDPLRDNSQNHQWVEGADCQFTQGAYHVKVTQQHILSPCLSSTTSFTNFVYQVQMTIVYGDDGCIVFRYTTANNGSYYAFCIGSNGSYGLLVRNQTGNGFTSLQSGQITISSNQANTVKVIAEGAELDLFVNGQYIATVNDFTYNQGSIGVAASDDTNSTDVAFSNAEVWQL